MLMAAIAITAAPQRPPATPCACPLNTSWGQPSFGDFAQINREICPASAAKALPGEQGQAVQTTLILISNFMLMSVILKSIFALLNVILKSIF